MYEVVQKNPSAAAAGEADQVVAARVVGAHEGQLARFAELFGGQAEALRVVQQRRDRRLNGVAEDVLDALALQALQHGRVVQVLPVLDHLDDLHFQQAGLDALAQMFDRSPAEGRGVDEHGDLGHAPPLWFLIRYSASPKH